MPLKCSQLVGSSGSNMQKPNQSGTPNQDMTDMMDIPTKVNGVSKSTVDDPHTRNSACFTFHLDKIWKVPSVAFKFMELYLRTKFLPNNEAFWEMSLCRYPTQSLAVYAVHALHAFHAFRAFHPQSRNIINKSKENISTMNWILHWNQLIRKLLSFPVPVAEDRTHQSRDSPSVEPRGLGWRQWPSV